MEAWVYNPSGDDRRLPHQYVPNRSISPAHLQELGVLHWNLQDVDDWECNPVLESIKKRHGFLYWETLTLAHALLENFEQITDHFFVEHLHPYEESRVILDGSGYWDIRDYTGQWIRFAVKKGDVIILPPGMYHRFTLDTNDYIKALLLYKEVPTRVELRKPEAETVEARKQYVDAVLSNPRSMLPSAA